MTLKKLNFKSTVALVIGSQIGSGIFLLPASLCNLGPISLFSWLISGAGAILLALIFGQLSMRVSKGGGPHVYIEKAFGKKAAFFTAWTYWLVSWVSSIAVIISAVGYLSPILHISSPLSLLTLEISILFLVVAINIKGADVAGRLEFFLTVLKCVPLLIIPFVALFFLKKDHFIATETQKLASFNSLNTAVLLTFWGFIGLETATTAASIIENPTKTIPRAIVAGTIGVAAIYFLNSFGIMGVVPREILNSSQAPYVDAATILFGHGWDLSIGIVAFIACLGTLNAWFLTSGQIASEAAKANLFPPLFAKTNRSGSPYITLIIIFICTAILLCLTLTPNIVKQLNTIIDVSVTTFLFIYLACSAAYLKILLKENKKSGYLFVIFPAALFCIWVIAFSSLPNILICSLFTLSGIPIYFLQRKKIHQIESL